MSAGEMEDKTAEDFAKDAQHHLIDLMDCLTDAWGAASEYDENDMLQQCYSCKGWIYEGDGHEPGCGYEGLYNEFEALEDRLQFMRLRLKTSRKGEANG